MTGYLKRVFHAGRCERRWQNGAQAISRCSGKENFTYRESRLSGRFIRLVNVIKQILPCFAERRQIARDHILPNVAALVFQSICEALNDGGFRRLTRMKFETEWV